MTERTPTEFRAIFDAWSKKHKDIPDSKIIPPKPRTPTSPRHADLSDELQGLLFWRHISKEVQPLSTNWMVADNDNNVDKEDDEPRAPVRSTECEHVIRPTENELLSAVEGVDSEPPRIYNARVPIPGPDVEYGEEYKACPPLKGYVRPIARIGSIRFATKDSHGAGRNMSPTRGSIIGWKAGPNTHGYFLVDTFGSPLGADGEKQEDIDSSNEFFADMLNAQPHRFIERGLCERGTETTTRLPTTSPSMTLNEARAIHGLEPAAPPSDTRPALPCGSRRASDSFIGHKITSGSPDNVTGDSAEDRTVRQQECIAIRAKLSTVEAKVLDTAIYASNFEDIGNVFGFRGKTAQRQGKTLLMAASRSLSTLIDKVAA